MKNLIVYYSYEGNCEEISKAIKNEIDADVLKLVPKKEKKQKVYLDLFGVEYKFIWQKNQN